MSENESKPKTIELPSTITVRDLQQLRVPAAHDATVNGSLTEDIGPCRC